MSDSQQARPTDIEQAVLGGGCFWCTEAVFTRVRGVQSVYPGYCGGTSEYPTYAEICGGDTGHIEVVQVNFDPRQISYADLLRVFFATHDPTTPDRQGNDVGPQYASAIFCQDDGQVSTARAVLNEMQPLFDAPIVTQIRGEAVFWPAEDEHRQYYDLNPEQGYCRWVIAPKVAALRERCAPLLRDGATG